MWVALLSEWELADFGDIFRGLLEPGSSSSECLPS